MLRKIVKGRKILRTKGNEKLTGRGDECSPSVFTIGRGLAIIFGPGTRTEPGMIARVIIFCSDSPDHALACEKEKVGGDCSGLISGICAIQIPG